MPDYPLIVFAAANARIPLAPLLDVLVAEGAQGSLGVDIAGEATEEQLNDPNWEAVFLRWLEPELHEAALIERMDRDTDEEAEPLIQDHLGRILRSSDVAGRMIVADALTKTHTVYGFHILPALLEDQNHGAWGVLEALLRFLAFNCNGLIYAEAEGYCDADGELMLAEEDSLYSVGALELD